MGAAILPLAKANGNGDYNFILCEKIIKITLLSVDSSF
jgi:hypothetical protein